MVNFIPNETRSIIPRDPPWTTKPLKSMLNRKNRFFKNYKKHGYKLEDKARLEIFRKEWQEAVETAKLSYLTNMGKKLNNPNTSRKSYWKIINKVMNKCNAPKIPPLLVNGTFVLNYREKAKLLTDFFPQQCKPVMNDSVLPYFSYLTNEKIEQISIENEDIISLIRKLNPNKDNGSDGISGQMLLLCDDSVVLPLKIIFGNILSTDTYPDIWKFANVTPIFKKDDKQLIENYRPISLLPLCGKIIFNNLYKHLTTHHLITKNQSGFRPGNSTTNQLIDLVDEIHQAFDSTKSLEVRVVFLDISKAFDGLIFKMRQNGISGKLLKQATELIFSCKKNSPNHPTHFFNESVVPAVIEQKHLGLILDSKLSFERHVNEKIIKAKKGIGIIKYLSKFLPFKTVDIIYIILYI